MALPDAQAGSTRGGVTLTWTLADDSVLDLTGATITGVIKDLSTGTERDIAGAIALIDASNGVLQWSYDAADVVAAVYEIQLEADYGDGDPARTFVDNWTVRPSLATL